MTIIKQVAPALVAGLAISAVPGISQDFGSGGEVASSQGIFVPFDISLYGSDIAVEMDGIDVTDFLVPTAGGFIVDPSVAPAGNVDVTIYALSGSGYEIVGSVPVFVEGGAAPSTYTIAATHEIGARNLNGDDTNEFARSSGSVEFDNPSAGLSGSVAYLATSEEEEELAGRAFDLESYTLEYSRSGGALDVNARLGDQSVSYDNALVSDNTQRGASLQFERPDQRLRFGIFGTEVGEPEGVDNFFGLAQDDDLIYGGTIAVQPIGGSDFTLGFSAYSGRGERFDGGTVGEGEGGAVFIQGSGRGGQLRYGLDVGWTEFDEDAELLAFGEVDGTAVLASVEYDVLGYEGPNNLTVGLGYERVEMDYFSLANTGLAVGREDVFLTLDFASEATTIGSALIHQLTNTGGPTDEPVDRIVSLSAYATHIPFYDTGAPAWLGDPQLNFDVLYETVRRKETPPLAIAPEDSDLIELVAGLYVQQDTYSWGAGYTFSDFDDRSAFNQDDTSHTIDGSFDWQIGETLNMGGSGYVIFNDNVDGTYEDYSISLNATQDFPDYALSWTGDLTYEDFGAPGSEDGLTMSSDWTWNFAPSTDLILSSSWSEGSLASETSEDPEWSVGLMLRATTNIFR